jgi:hypothetical protein
MSSRFLFSCLGVAALAVCGMFSVNAVLATCPQTKAYERQCLETVSVCAGDMGGCTLRKQQESVLGNFGCNSNGENNTECIDSASTYAACYREYACVQYGTSCIKGNNTGNYNRLVKTTVNCP